MISDAEFLAWLRDDRSQRVLLAEAVYHDGVTTQTAYLGSRDYTSGPSDTPANRYYQDRLKSIPTFTRRMSEQLTGRTVGGWGDFELDNLDGELDAWLGYGWDGRALTLYIGDATWARNDFRVVMAGVTEDIIARDETTIALRARDEQYLLERPITTARFTTGDNADRLKPVLYGQCRNIEPVVENSPTLKYCAHDGRMQAFDTVYNNGLSVGHTDTVATGSYVLTAGPAGGQITADARGAISSGSPSTYLTKVGQIIEDILIYRAGVSAANIASSDFVAFNALCPQTVGVYVREGGEIVETTDALALSVGAYYGPKRDGKWTIDRLNAPTGSYVLAIDEDDIVEFGMSIKSRQIPAGEIQLGYKRRWTVQKSGLAGAVSNATLAELAEEYSVAKASNLAGSPLAIGTKHLRPRMPELEGTLLYSQAEADAEATRRAVLESTVRTVYRLEGFLAPFLLELGDEILITYPRFGFDSGLTAIVVGFEESPTANRMVLEVWR